MNRQRQFPTWLGAVLGTICALFIFALGAHASDHRGAFTEEFHQTYAITPDGVSSSTTSMARFTSPPGTRMKSR
jgi:hypothetical protein